MDKRCSKCQHLKNIDDFYKQKEKTSFRYSSRCKQCIIETSKSKKIYKIKRQPQYNFVNPSLHNKKIKKYYVYAILDPRKPGQHIYDDITFDYEPFYIGKGYSARMVSHINPKNLLKHSAKNNKINKILKNNLVPILLKLDDNLCETKALINEAKTIRKIGRLYEGKNFNGKILKQGPLLNFTNGWDGMSTYKSIRRNKNKIYRIDKNTLLIDKIFDNVFDAVKGTPKSFTGNIIKCCKNYHTTAGYFWSFDENYDKSKFIINRSSTKINHLQKDGKLIKTYDSISNAAKELNIKSKTIMSICQRNHTCINDTYFEYVDNELKNKYINKPLNFIKQTKSKSIKCINIVTGEELIFQKFMQCVKHFNVTNKTIYSWMKENSNKNYRFEYYNG